MIFLLLFHNTNQRRSERLIVMKLYWDREWIQCPLFTKKRKQGDEEEKITKRMRIVHTMTIRIIDTGLRRR